MTQLAVELRHAKRNQVISLDFSNRMLTYLPKEIYALTALARLDLSNNKIANIDP